MSSQMLFIDPLLKGFQSYLNNLAADIEVVVLDPVAGGLSQIAEMLSQRRDLAAIHIVSHAAVGRLHLAGSDYDLAGLEGEAATLASIGASLADGGDILLYGCDLARDTEGEAFLAAFSRLSGADVSASDNLTGIGGDWVLERATGAIEVATLAAPRASLTLALQLDTGFAGDGTVVTDFGAVDYGRDLAMQSDGKIVVAGFSGSNFFQQDFALARYNTNGTLDTSFSGDGKQTTTLGISAHGEAVAIQSDGKIVVAGGTLSDSYEFDFAVVRYTTSGVLDTSFSGDGKLTTDLGNDDTAYAVAIQSDGKIVVAGESVAGVGLARYTASGALDTTFSGDGKVVVIPVSGAYLGSGMALQADGKILVAGYSSRMVSFFPTPSSDRDFMLMRFNTNGSQDTTFGTAGVVVTDLGTTGDEGEQVVVQSDGKILVAGYTANGFALVRYNSNGVLDTGFGGGDGIVTTAMGAGASGFGVTLQNDGKFLMTGTGATGACVVARYTTAGALDASFDADGLYSIDFGGVAATGYAVKTLSSGDILIAATVWQDAEGANTDFGVARLSNAGGGTTNLNRTGTSGNDILNGGAGNDTLTGLAGNDTLNGGAGSDSMVGGAGNDFYVVDATGDRITELPDQGTDTVQSGIAYTLGANLENLILSGTAHLAGTGNGLNNIVVGNAGNNALNGAAGSDTAAFTNATRPVTANLASGIASGDGNDTLSGFEHLSGSAGNDSLTGNAGNNVLSGIAGNDTLDGGVGADTLRGGLGNDVYVVDSTSDRVVELADQGIDLIQAGLGYSLVDTDGTGTSGGYVENLTLTGNGHFEGSGNTLNNLLTGNTGNNRLTGGDGNDTLNGGVGNDTLGGERGNDSLLGGAGNDLLDGGAGIDTLAGGAGNDIYVLDVVQDHVLETANQGVDTVRAGFTCTLGTQFENLTLLDGANRNGTGNSGNNVLLGNSGNNNLSGLAGADTLTGAAGTDTLSGGAGSDQFRFVMSTEGADRITDFSKVEGDKLVFVSANFRVGVGALAASRFRSNLTGLAGDTDDRFVFETDTRTLRYDADGNGTGTSVAIAILNINNLSASDILIAAT